MEKVHESSAPAHKGEVVNLWGVPHTQEDIEADSGYFEVINPSQNIATDTNVVLTASAGPYMTDLAQSYCQVEFQVTKTGGSIVDADACSLINLVGHTLWQKVDLFANDVRISDGNGHYPYQAALLTLLGKNPGWADSAGTLEGYYKDAAGNMNDTTAANSGFVTRKGLIKAAAVGDAAPTVSVAMRPILGAFQQNRLIPDRTELRLELERVKDSFALISNAVAGATITLTRVRWFVRRCNLTEAANKHMVATFAKHRALYPVDRIRVHIEQVTTSSFDLTKILAGPIPTHCIIAFVQAAAVQGQNAALNPLNFEHHGLRKLQLTAAGKNFPRRELAPAFSGTTLNNARVSREYFTALQVAQKHWGVDGPLFSMADYCGGFAIYGFDLTPDLSTGHWSPSYRGDIEIHGEFATRPANPISIIVVATVPSVFEVGEDRSIVKDW